jgi:hypothetical protein
MRDDTVKASTDKIDKILSPILNKDYLELPISDIEQLITLTIPDQAQSEHVWDQIAVAESVAQFAKVHEQRTGYVYVDRERGLKQNRRETQGILEGGEAGKVPKDKITLFVLRTAADGKNVPAWWPQIRFPEGQYAFAFAI